MLLHVAHLALTGTSRQHNSAVTDPSPIVDSADTDVAPDMQLIIHLWHTRRFLARYRFGDRYL